MFKGETSFYKTKQTDLHIGNDSNFKHFKSFPRIVNFILKLMDDQIFAILGVFWNIISGSWN